MIKVSSNTPIAYEINASEFYITAVSFTCKSNLLTEQVKDTAPIASTRKFLSVI